MRSGCVLGAPSSSAGWYRMDSDRLKDLLMSSGGFFYTLCRLVKNFPWFFKINICTFFLYAVMDHVHCGGVLSCLFVAFLQARHNRSFLVWGCFFSHSSHSHTDPALCQGLTCATETALQTYKPNCLVSCMCGTKVNFLEILVFLLTRQCGRGHSIDLGPEQRLPLTAFTAPTE